MVQNNRLQVYSLLRKYGYLTTDQIVSYHKIVFGTDCKWHTARKYRDEYEKKHVDLVAKVGSQKRFTQGEYQKKAYIHNGKPFGRKHYTIPFSHAVALFFKSWRVMLHKITFENA